MGAYALYFIQAISKVVALLLTGAILYIVVSAFYNCLLHPLRRYPGPFLVSGEFLGVNLVNLDCFPRQ